MLALPAAAVLVALVAVAAATTQEDVSTSFGLVVFGCVAAALILMVPYLDAAWPLTAGLLLSVFSGNWDSLGIPVGLDRLLLLPGIAAVFAQQLRHEDDAPRLRVLPVHWLLAAFVLYAIGSAVFAGTLLDREPLFALLDKLGIVSFLLFVVAPVAFASGRQRDVLLTGLVSLGAYLGLTALFEALDVRTLVFPAYINDPTLGIHVERARGPFLEAAANGLALYGCAVAAAVAFATWRSPWARRSAVAVALLCGLGLIFTLTRQVWLGAALATVVTLVAVPDLRRFLLPFVLVGGLLVGGSFVAVAGLQEQSSERAGSSRPIWDRLNSNRAALEMVRAEPLLGAGWYRFGPESPGFYQLADGFPLTQVDRPHNVFVATAAELGLVGLVLFVSTLWLGIGRQIMRRGPPELRPWRIALLAITINWLVISNFTPLGYAFANYLPWVLAGVVMGGARALSR